MKAWLELLLQSVELNRQLMDQLNDYCRRKYYPQLMDLQHEINSRFLAYSLIHSKIFNNDLHNDSKTNPGDQG